LKIPVANFVVLLLHKLILDMSGVFPPEISIAYGLWIQRLLNQSRKYFWNCV